jgi:hypothetical protein
LQDVTPFLLRKKLHGIMRKKSSQEISMDIVSVAMKPKIGFSNTHHASTGFAPACAPRRVTFFTPLTFKDQRQKNWGTSPVFVELDIIAVRDLCRI